MATLAIVSDFHANLVALETVLADMDRFKPDQVVCLGDVAATGPQPAGVLARMKPLGWRVVRGNCDDKVLRVAAGAAEPPHDEHEAVDHWCASVLSADDLAFVATFEPVVNVQIDDVRVCCYHGSPHSNLDEILPGTDDHTLERWLRGQHATVYAGGHTHVQMVRRRLDTFVINPGSAGLPFMYRADGSEVNPSWAEYALVHADGGTVGVELRRCPVDREALLASAINSEMPHREWWSSGWA